MKAKKCISWIAVVSILSTMLVFNVHADAVSITLTGGDKAGYPIQVSITDGTTPAGTWQISTDNVTFSDITLNAYTDTAESYAIKPSNKNKYIRYTQTIDGATLYSNVVGPLPASIGSHLNQNTAAEWAGLNANPDSNYKFKPSGASQTFTLLDTTLADSDGVFVIANSGYGRILLGNNGVFDPSVADSAADKLNGLATTGSWEVDWYGNKKTFTLPAAIKNCLNEHEWYTDAGTDESGKVPADYVYSGKLSLLSYTEWMKYRDKIGYTLEANRSDYWILRTLTNSTPEYMHAVDHTQNGRIVGQPLSRYHDIRPCFYLDKSYFLNNKIDVSTAGSEVKKFIMKSYTKGQLSANAGYTDGELATLGYVENAVSLTGGATAGDLIEVSITNYVTPAGTWQISTDNVTFTDITPNAYTDTAEHYAIKPGNRNKYIRYTQTIDGETLYSNVIGPLPASVGPISNGNTETVNEAANADKVFSPANAATKGFIVLDTSNADTDGLFVLARDAYGRVKFDDDNQDRFDPDKSNNIAYKLNQLLENGSWTATIYNSATFTFPIAKQYINNHEWYTEAGHASGYAPADYKVTTKLALLSRTEWEQYKNEIGSKPTDSAYANYTWLRTGSGNGANTVTITVNGGSSGLTYTATQSRAINNPANALHAVRPCFYLDKSYFLNNKINVATAGKEVKEFIVDTFTISEMAATGLYTASELEGLGYYILDISSVKNENDVDITLSNIKAASAVKVTYDTEFNRTGYALIALFNSSDRFLYGKTSNQINFVAGGGTEEIALGDLSELNDVAAVYVMLWSDLSTAVPLSDKYTIDY